MKNRDTTQPDPRPEVGSIPSVLNDQQYIVEIPKLTKLLHYSRDPELKPFMHINRVYPYPVTRKLVKIPAYLHVPQRVKRLPGPDWAASQGVEAAARKRHKFN